MQVKKDDLLRNLPVTFSYSILGLMFGYLFSKAGAFWWESFALSLTAFAGAAQFLSLNYYNQEGKLSLFLLAILAINFRHLFYGLQVKVWLPNTWSWKKFYTIFTLSDENFCHSTNSKVLKGTYDFLPIFALNHATWVASCTIGTFLPSIPLPGNVPIFVLSMFFLLNGLNKFLPSKSRKIGQ